jgi:hypothetical protein
MSKHLSGLQLARAGKAVAAGPSHEETLEPREKVSNERRRRTWEGKDDTIKVNFEIPERVQDKLHQLKAWKRIRVIKDFVTESLEAACDREIAKAEKEGY